MKPDTREWVKKAEDDFKVTSQLLRRRKDIVSEAACFHGQQCVEKYLKARLCSDGARGEIEEMVFRPPSPRPSPPGEGELSAGFRTVGSLQ